MIEKLKTFDEWYESRYGASFEVICQVPGARYDDIFRELSKEIRNYVSDCMCSKASSFESLDNSKEGCA